MVWSWAMCATCALCIVCPLVAIQVARGGFSSYRFLYLNGPAIMGGWEGHPPADICAQLTHVSPQIWSRELWTKRECAALIDRKVTSHLVGSLVVIAVCALYHISQCASYLLMWRALGSITPPAPRAIGFSSPARSPAGDHRHSLMLNS